MPQALKRGVNALSGALDAADIAFQAIRIDRDRYKKDVSESAGDDGLAQFEVNVDSLKSFLQGKLVDMPYESRFDEGRASLIVGKLYSGGYKTLASVDRLLDSTTKARDWFAAWFYDNHPSVYSGSRNALSEVLRTLYIAEPRSRMGVAPNFQEAYKQASQQSSST